MAISKEEFLKNIDMDALAREYQPIIDGIIRRKKYDRIAYSTHDYDDLLSVGFIGLIEALGRYDPEVGDFENYARVSIRGKISDFTRKESHTTRSGRTVRRQMNAVEKELTEILGRPPYPEELAEELEVTISRLDEMRVASVGRSYVSIEGGYSSTEDDSSDLIENLISMRDSINESEQVDYLERKQVIEIIEEEIKNLPTQEKTVLNYWIHNNYRLKEISEAMKLTPSRASQIKTNAIKMLKEGVACRL